MGTSKLNLKDSLIIVVGLGYVGLPLACAFSRFHRVIGFDTNCSRIEELRNGHDRTLELTAEDLARYPIEYVSSLTKIKRETTESPTVFIVTVPTPVDESKRPDLGPLVSATESVSSVLRSGDVVVYESTVYPGATEELCIPIIERLTGLPYAANDLTSDLGFHCAYSPERVNPGDKTRRLKDIQKIVGAGNLETAAEVAKLYSEIIEAPVTVVGSIKVAEAAKVIENSQRDINIAFVNELSIIFDRMGLDTSQVLKAAGTKWNFLNFSPGLVGGHCIGVDPYYLTHKAEALGYRPEVILAGRRINDNMPSHIASKFSKLLANNGVNVGSARVLLMGLTFKENCPDIRNSLSIRLARELKEWGMKVFVTDPYISSNTELNDQGLQAFDPNSEKKFDSIVISVAHDEYRRLDIRELRDVCAGADKPVIADLKGIYKKSDLESLGFTVFRL